MLLLDVKTGLLLDVTRTQTIVNDVDFISILVLSHAKVGRLDITMNVLPIVDESQNLNDLYTKCEHCEHRESLSVLWKPDQGV